MISKKEKMLIQAYVDGELSPEEARQIDERIKADKEYMEYYEQVMGIGRAVRMDRGEGLSPDADIRIKGEVLSRPNKEVGAMKARRRNKWAVAGGLVVVALVAFMWLGNVFLKRSQQAALRDSVVSLRLKRGKLKNEMQFQPYYTTKGISASSQGPVVSVQKSVNTQVSPEVVYMYSSSARSVRSIQMAGGLSMEKTVLLGGVSMSPANYSSQQDFNTESYDYVAPNDFLSAKDNPLSTFSIDVDTASYSNIRRFLNNGQLPPEGSVRLEEMINYFSYDYPQPKGDEPFSITIKGANCPWKKGHKLVMIGLKGKVPNPNEIPESNIVFLIDVSGSMDSPDKLPLLKKALKMMVNRLSEKEHIAIVVYAGSSGLVLDSTDGTQKYKILSAIDNLSAGGSTNGAEGIKLAYQVAQSHYIKGGNNRVILATDGDFNVGVSSESGLVRLIEKERQKGIFLTVLGFGTGNLQDSKMEKLADKGNGSYHYIDSEDEAYKVLVKELGSTLFTIAKDVKIQIEFNPAKVKSYRLIGYENRLLKKEDFNDDKKDAGELGAGHTVTALYEIVPADSEEEASSSVDPLKYQKTEIVNSDEVMTVKLRYKEPDADKSKLIVKTVKEDVFKYDNDPDLNFAAAVAEFGMILRNSPYKEDATYDNVIELAKKGIKSDASDREEREEFIELVKKAKKLDNRKHYEEGEGISFKGERKKD